MSEPTSEYLNDLGQRQAKGAAQLCAQGRGPLPSPANPPLMPHTHHQLQVAHALRRVLPQARREQGRLKPGWHKGGLQASQARVGSPLTLQRLRPSCFASWGICSLVSGVI